MEIYVLITIFIVLLIYYYYHNNIDTFTDKIEEKKEKEKKKDYLLLPKKSKYKIPAEDFGMIVHTFPNNNYFTISNDGLNLSCEYDKTNKIIRAVLETSDSKNLLQQWQYNDGTLINRSNHLHLAVYNNIKGDNIPLYLTNPDQTNGQYFSLDNEGIIRTRLSGGKISYRNINKEKTKIKKDKIIQAINHAFVKLGKGLNTGYNQKWIITTTDIIDDTPAPVDPIISNELLIDNKKKRNRNFLSRLKKII